MLCLYTPPLNFWMAEPVYLRYGMYIMAPELISAACFINSSRSQSYVTTDGQSASLSWCQAPMWGLRPDLYYCRTFAGMLMWGALSDERMGLPFTIAAGAPQRSHSRVRVPQDIWPYFTVSDSRLPQPGGPGPLISIPQDQGGPVILPGTGFPFRRLLRLAGLWWKYSNPPPYGWTSLLGFIPTISLFLYMYSLSLLGNGSVKTSPRKRIHATIKELLHASSSLQSMSYQEK
jgi:hypothetical protein